MDKQNTPNRKLTLEEVGSKLEHWRKIKRNHREPIPKDLWQAAAELAGKHSINTVSKKLRLSYVDLKNRVYPSPKPRQANKEKASFIELGYGQPSLMPETTLEMETEKGSRLKICFKGRTDFDLMALVKTFCQKGL